MMARKWAIGFWAGIAIIGFGANTGKLFFIIYEILNVFKISIFIE